MEKVEEKIILTEEEKELIKQELKKDGAEYFKNNEVKKHTTKIVDLLKPKIMDNLTKLDILELTFDTFKIKKSSSISESFDYDKLMEICKGLNIEGLIKTREYVDEEFLETLIYERDIDAKILIPAKTKTTTYRLLVNGVK